MAMNTMYGFFYENVWRDEKTGNSCFLFKTTASLFDSHMYQRKEVIRNKVTNKEEIWYTVFCNASDISVPARYRNTPIKVTGHYDVSTTKLNWEFVVADVTDATQNETVTIQFLTEEPFNELLTKEEVSNIVGTYGHDIFALASEPNPEKKLMQVTKLDYERAENVVNLILKFVTEKELLEFLYPAKIPYPYTLKAILKYGRSALSKLKKNPYVIGSSIGLNFNQCDRIAIACGHSPASAERIRQAGEEVLKYFESSGHIYTPLNIFLRNIKRKIQNDTFDITLPDTNIVALLGSNFGYERIHGQQVVYRKALVEAERRVAKNILRLALVNTIEHYDNSLIAYAEKACKISYGNQQRTAFSNTLARRGIKILTGGPGTGKTTTIKGILLVYERMNPTHIIKLCAPTGRAAQKMTEATGREATTIHKLLDMRPFGENVSYKNADNPIEADFIIIDEVSMVDIELMDKLLEATKTGTTLVLVGDIHQLESVGSGAILRDLLSVSDSLIKKSLLTEIFRQKGDSPIIENAKRINDGNVDLWACNDFQIISAKSSEEALEAVMDLTKTLYNPDNPFDMQILCLARSGLTGIDNLNSKLHDMLNKQETDKILIYGSVQYRIQDKIIFTRNNPIVGYYNGDIGVITDIQHGEISVEIRGEKITLTQDALADMQLSYGMTIHKSQGSEFPYVIVVMPMEPNNMLVRNLFYTAVTRAKKRVYVINEGSAMQTAIKVDKSGYRRTFLPRFIPVNANRL